MSSRETSMEDSDSFLSDTDAVIHGNADYSGRTESLISDPNIPNYSSSTSEDENQQQIISTAAGDGNTDDDLIVSSSSCGSSSWFKINNNNEQSVEHREIRIFNVDFRALSQVSYVQSAYKSKVDDNPTAAAELQMPFSQSLPDHHRRSSSSFRLIWTSALHARFVHAVELLGGHERATAKSIQELMDIKDLKISQVRSHLQMYRTIKFSMVQRKLQD